MNRKMICILVLMALLLSVSTVVAPAPTPGPSGGGGGGSSLSLQNFINKLESWKKEDTSKFKQMTNLLGISDSNNRGSVKPPELIDRYVIPTSGNWSDEFVYGANIKSINDSETVLGLEVFIPSTKIWRRLDDKDVRSYMYNKDHIASIQWKFKEFTPDDVGNSSRFRFYYYDQSNNKKSLGGEWNGPKNITKQILDLRYHVDPENGTSNDMYNYSVQVHNPSRGRMKVALEVLLPGSNEWYPVGEKLLYPSRYDASNNATITWNVRPFSLDDVNKSSSFRLSYEDDRQNSGTVVAEGPRLENHPAKILASWVEPPNGTSRQSFTYHTVVRDIDGDDLQAKLVIYDSNRGDTLTSLSQGVRGIDASNQNGSELIWLYKFAESYENKSFQYNASISDGVVEATTGNISGPAILALPTITVDVLPPESQNNNWWDEYKFTVRVDNPSVQTARFTPAILTSKGWNYLEPWEVAQTSGPETHEWKFSKFTSNDRNKPISFDVRYTLPDQYGNFMWASKNQNEKQMSDVVMSGLPMAFNLIWIGLLGAMAYLFAGSISQVLSRIGGKKS